jgi:hypothetical protein
MAAEQESHPLFEKGAGRFVRNVVLKALLLFVVFNVLFALLDPMPFLGRISLYNGVFPGRLRLPYGENPELSHNLSLFQMEAMFSSHDVAARPQDGEFRVLVIGDSSVWGFLLRADQTTTALINAAQYRLQDGRTVHAFNLGYPIMSLFKDVLILQQAMAYEPDMVVWLVTLESFPDDKQLESPLVQHNAARAQDLISLYKLSIDTQDPSFVIPSFWDRTIIGQRRGLADMIRLQLYGVLWADTGIDTELPEEFALRMEDLEADDSFHEVRPPQQLEPLLAQDVLQAGASMAGDLPFLLINEPIFISRGENSDIRYNFNYPRWAYDAYRSWLAQTCAQNGWHCADFWDAIDAEQFTNTAFHLTPYGSAQLATLVGESILEVANASLQP